MSDETVTVTYDGPIAALEITDPRNPGGPAVGVVERGKTVDVPKHVADDLLQREDFSLPKVAKAEKKGDA